MRENLYCRLRVKHRVSKPQEMVLSTLVKLMLKTEGSTKAFSLPLARTKFCQLLQHLLKQLHLFEYWRVICFVSGMTMSIAWSKLMLNTYTWMFAQLSIIAERLDCMLCNTVYLADAWTWICNSGQEQLEIACWSYYLLMIKSTRMTRVYGLCSHS